jgi:urea carboxylase
MSKTTTAIIDALGASEGKPSVTYRQAGDRALLVEYGEMELDLALNFFVLAVDAAVADRPLDGLIETAPGFRSMLVSYDPLQLSTGDLLDHLRTVHEELPSEREMEIASRLIRLPIAFDDSQTRAAVRRYLDSIRADAPNCEGANNIDYIVRYNGLADREELYASVLATEHWTGFIGFFPGLPFMFPIDPRHVVVVPKYTRRGRGRRRARSVSAGPASPSIRWSRPAAISCSVAACRSMTFRRATRRSGRTRCCCVLGTAFAFTGSTRTS